VAEKIELTRPWLVAVWPGMGHVALNAGIYLLAKLGMTAFAEYDAAELFDIEQVEVKDGMIQPGRRPRNRFFAWTDPNGEHDLVVFLGEAQPPTGKFTFCRHLISFAKNLGVERVFTFAAMATQMHPGAESRVFGAATDSDNLQELKQLELEMLEDGHIGGLNGVLLAAAQLPFPKASHAILEAFTTIAHLDLDLDELSEQAKLVEEQLGELLAQVEKQRGDMDDDEDGDDEEGSFAESADEEESPPEAEHPRKREPIERLFKQAAQDRSKAFELKQELDRLGVFKEYEDRFLDLFKHPE
jgi:hypothetical protein